MWFTRVRSSKPKEGFRLGLELEIEGHGLQAASRSLSSNFIIESDGSLRDGLEIKSRAGYNYNQTLELISSYSEFLDKCKAKATPRTSVHIHVNTQDMSTDQLKSFLWLSIAMEPVLLRFCSALRNHNAYCIPVYNSINLIQHWKNFIRWLDDPNFSGATTPPKYAAVGGFRLFDLGTIEFRMFPGCTNAMKLRWYVDILKAMYDVAVANTVDTLRDKKLSEGLLSLITNVVIDNRKGVSLTELESLIDLGTQMANDILRTPLTKENLLAAHAALFPSQYKAVTDTTIVDLFKSTNLKASLAEYDPDELQASMKNKAFQMYKYLVQHFPEHPVKVANFIQELTTLGVTK